ncbi:MAG: hypothetical protein ABI462_03995 [Ignavibacteria bacterium]
MREYIVTKEFNGKLEFEDFSIENVRCIYEDDYYSNRIMKGRFILKEDQRSISLMNEPFRTFLFSDINGRVLKGQLNGSSLENEYNSHWQELSFDADEYSQRLRWSENKFERIKLRFHIPYIKDLSRHLKFSHDFYPEWLFRFDSIPFKIKINDHEFVFDERVYCYKHKEPDNILARELFIKVQFTYGNQEIVEILEKYESIVEDIMLIVSFVFNHRMRSYSYYAELLDEKEKLVETIEFKESNKLCGEDYLKKSNEEFRKFLNSDNLSKLIQHFIDKNSDDKKNITSLINKFITIGETEIFEPKFVSAYFLLEAISKFIVSENIGGESLIKRAVEISKVEMEIFKISHKREEIPNSKCEWEITEYRNYLTHFNYQDEYDGQLMYEEYEKVLKLNRKMLLWIIYPDLSDWPLPK